MADMPGKHAADATADEKRTTLSLSLTVSDKKTLKMMAAQRYTQQMEDDGYSLR